MHQLLTNPYLKIFYCPTRVIASLNYFQPTRGVLLIALLFGLSYSSAFLFLDDNVESALLFLLIIRIPMGIIYGLLCIFSYTVLLYLSSLIVRVNIPFITLHQVVVWSLVPGICINFLLGNMGFLLLAPDFGENNVIVVPIIFIGLLLLPYSWAFTIQLLGFYQLTGRKAKSLLLCLSPLLILFAITLIGKFAQAVVSSL